MSKYLDRAKELRAIVDPHYNCAQSVALPFAPDAGLTEELAYQIAANFGAGMHMASVCGAFTGGLIALGFYGLTGPQIVSEYAKMIKDKHHGTLICAELLKINKDLGLEKKPHCDGMVYDCVEAVEALLRANGKIQ